MAKTALKIFYKQQGHFSNMAIDKSLFSTMAGESFKILDFQMAKTALKNLVQTAGTFLKWPKTNLCSPPWLEKISKFKVLKWLKLHLKSANTKNQVI